MQSEVTSHTPRLLTVTQFSERHPAFTESALRWLIFRAKPRYRTDNGKPSRVEGNGFASAIKRVHSRVYLDEGRFFAIVEELNSEAESVGSAA